MSSIRKTLQTVVIGRPITPLTGTMTGIAGGWSVACINKFLVVNIAADVVGEDHRSHALIAGDVVMTDGAVRNRTRFAFSEQHILSSCDSAV